MTVAETVWEQIRRGRAPSPTLVSDVVSDAGVVLGEQGLTEVRDALASRVLGAGPLDPLLASPGVTDVLVNSAGGVWVERDGRLEQVPVVVGGEEDVRRLAVRLSGLAGRRLDETSPYVDGQLPGGIRLHAVLPPLAADGTHISLRVPRQTTPVLSELGRRGAFGPGWLPVLRALVHRRLAFVITGGTGSGKTTLLAALLGEVSGEERLVVVEDVMELSLRHPHVVRLQTRAPNVEGRGAVTLTTLVRQSLRMRPDRVVVGEVRGPEVRELLTALNTGHEGGCGTVHANTSADVVARFEALGALADMTPGAVHAQLSSAIRVVLHVERVGGVRRLATIGVLERGAGREPVVVPALRRAADGSPLPAEGWGRLASLCAVPEELDALDEALPGDAAGARP